MPVKVPHTPSEKRAMLDLIRWVSDRADVNDAETTSIIGKAQRDDWTDAIDLLSTYYFMKGIKAPKQRAAVQ